VESTVACIGPTTCIGFTSRHPASIDVRSTPSPWRVAAFELRRAISAAAAAIGAARDGAELVLRTDGPWQVAQAVARSRYCLAIADVARALAVSRQAGHALVHAAVREGLVALEPNPDDRRLLQLSLTPHGRASLEAATAREAAWLAVLLNGLGDREMATTTHVLTVLRQRLERDARELARLGKRPVRP
jgi:DNA-binding MarR family transcriptional regulator